MIQQEPAQFRASKHRGAALVVAIVCVSIAAAVMYGIVQLAMQAHREVHLEQRQAQARWIMESAVDRAAAQLAADEDYGGEHWSVPTEELGGRYMAEVRIQVERGQGHADLRRVRIVADYPVELPQRVRQTREFRIGRNPRVDMAPN